MIVGNRIVRRPTGIVVRSGVAGSAVMLATTSWAIWSPRFSGATTTAERAASTIITPDDSRDPNGGAPLTGGGAGTAFSFALPPGAACDGDSASGGYRIQSYMASDSVDPGTLQFGSNGPTPSATGAAFRHALFDASSTASYVNIQTAMADVPGGPGLILAIPSFNFAVLSPGDIVPGTYNIGLACTLGPVSPTQLKKYWNAQMTFDVDASDPAGIKWTAVPSTDASAGRVVAPAPVPVAKRMTTGSSESGSSTGATPLDAARLALPSESPAGSEPSTVESGKISAEEPDRGGGEPTFTPMLELLTQAPRPNASTGSLLVWGTVLIVLARMAILLRRPTVSRKAAIR